MSYTNVVGGQDELVFDGQSMVIDGKGRLLVSGQQFEEDLLITDLKVPDRKPAVGRSKTQHFESIDRIVLSERPAPKKKPLTARKSAGPFLSARRSTRRSCSARVIMSRRPGSSPR